MDDSEKQKVIIHNLGGTCVDTWSECTHLITDKVRRTVKFLAALAAGKHVVSTKWLDQCKKESRFVDEGKFIIKDKQNESKYSFSLDASVKAAQNHCFLDGFTIYSMSNVKPSRNDMKEIITAAGGTLVESVPKGMPSDTDKFVVIGSDDDAAECVALISKGYVIQSNEFILTGCLQQKVDFDTHRLVLSNHGGGTSSSAAAVPESGRKKKK
ncbi:BRCT domain-containing protein [Obelidium mucronatum]|nr:BRCT domain-containing protein [Obelidium mucronatum]